jgi:MFS transporter, AAHS family, 3-hydroxyphenylpropionic acid transporter
MNPPHAVASAKASEYLTAALCCLAMICEGFDLQAPGVTLASLREVFALGPQIQGLFLSIGTFGMMIGAIAGGRLADRIGRKQVLIGAILLYSLFTLLTVFAGSTFWLLAIRLLTGIGLGAALPTIISIAAEGVSEGRRDLTVGILLAGPPIGAALVSLLAAINSQTSQWQQVYIVGGLVPALIVAPALWQFLPDSFRSLAGAKRVARTDVGHTLFGGGRASRTVAIWIAFFAMLLVLFVLVGWLPSLFISRGMSRSGASLLQMLFNLGAIPGTILAGYAFGRPATRTASLVAFFLLSILALLMFGYSPLDLRYVIPVGVVGGMVVAGSQAIIYALAPRIYPTAGRSTGMGFSVAVGRIGSAIGPLLVGWMIAAQFLPMTVIHSLIPAFALAGLMALLVSRLQPGADCGS